MAERDPTVVAFRPRKHGASPWTKASAYGLSAAPLWQRVSPVMVGLPLAAFAAVLLWPTPPPAPREAPAATAPAAPPASQAELRARLWPTSAAALDAAQPAIEPASQPAFAPDALATHFTLCGGGARIDCVVDGDTFWFRGEKIRVADINTPEVSAPQCAREAALGAQATGRLQALLNAGPFTLERVDRDRDRYGRLLRTVTRGGESLGLVLVREGLAEVWRGSRSSWC